MANREQRRHPDPEAPASALEFSVDGTRYRLDRDELTGALELELWQQAKLTVPEVIDIMTNHSGSLFALAALLFLARRQAGEAAVVYADVMEGLGTYGDEIDVTFHSGDEVPAGPEV